LDKRAALASAHVLAKPWLRLGFRFAGLYRYGDADGVDVYAKLSLCHPQTGERTELHLGSGPVGYELRDEAPDRLPPYLLAKIAARPDEPVFLVADESTADDLHERGVLATSANPRADWTALSGRPLLVWADQKDGWFVEVVDGLVSADVGIELIDAGTAGSASAWLAAHPATVPPDLLRSKVLALPRIRPQERANAEDASEPLPVDEMLPAVVPSRHRSMREAVEFLRSALASSERLASEIREESRQAGFHWRTIQAAASHLGVRRTKVGMRGGWVWRAPEDADQHDPKAHEGARRCAVDVGEGEPETVRESVRGNRPSDSAAVQEVCTEVGQVEQSAAGKSHPGNAPDQGATVPQTVAQTVGNGLVKRVVTELSEDKGRLYAIRARSLSDGSAQIAIAARSGPEEIGTTVLQVRCDEATLRSAFDRIGGPGRAQFESSADQLTGLLGRATALAHATMEVVASIAAPTGSLGFDGRG
jgi:hypothetical protein